MSILLGCIADDFTGATDIASFLVASGMRTLQLTETPSKHKNLDDIDAVVIALKSRTQEKSEAIKDSIIALNWLLKHDCEQFYFKYCSTFDSTSLGNIGPVTDALLDCLDEKFTIFCPSLPVNGRTVYKGHLFVNGSLLNESGMENHPLTPMKDSNIVRVLKSQTKKSVALVEINEILKGVEELRDILKKIEKNAEYAVIDTITNENLFTIGQACADLKLLTGGSGLAMSLADNFEAKGLFTKNKDSAAIEYVDGHTVVLSGSCSPTTQEQVAVFQKKYLSLKLDPIALFNGDQTIDEILTWYERKCHESPLLIYATDTPELIKQSQNELGIEKSGEIIELTIAVIVTRLRKIGVKKFVVAGGETSGAVVKALSLKSLKVGPTIAPGVPIMQSLEDDPCLVALKSGNFGDKDFFEKSIYLMNN